MDKKSTIESNKDFKIIYGARDMIKAGKLDPGRFGMAEARYLELSVKHAPGLVPACYKPSATQ